MTEISISTSLRRVGLGIQQELNHLSIRRAFTRFLHGFYMVCSREVYMVSYMFFLQVFFFTWFLTWLNMFFGRVLTYGVRWCFHVCYMFF